MGRETDFDLEAHAGRLAVDGYTILPDFLSPADLAEARARIDALSDSHLWDEGRAAEAPAAGGGPGLVPAVMPAGSAIVLQGNLIHRGGANRSAAPRLAVTHQYCQPWARTQENFF
ncbi:MAG: phytanoyl-CoA dioxygenase family protein, partial [Phenylobacterium sp.]